MASEDQASNVGIVIVSHSYKIAVGVKELVSQVVQGNVRVAAAGGLDRKTLGTSAIRIKRAIRSASGKSGVIVLTDLGSSVLNSRMALELLPEAVASRVIISSAPIVEGALAAALAASHGDTLAQVEAAALAAANKSSSTEDEPEKSDFSTEAGEKEAPAAALEASYVLPNPAGVHARSAVTLIQTAKQFKSGIWIQKAGGSPIDLKTNCMFKLLKMGAVLGDELTVRAEGEDAAGALQAIGGLIENGFGEIEVKKD